MRSEFLWGGWMIGVLVILLSGCNQLGVPLQPAYAERVGDTLVLQSDCESRPMFVRVSLRGRDASGTARRWAIKASGKGSPAVTLLGEPPLGWSLEKGSSSFAPVGKVELDFDSEIGPGDWQFDPAEVAGTKVVWVGGVTEFSQFRDKAGSAANKANACTS